MRLLLYHSRPNILFGMGGHFTFGKSMPLKFAIKNAKTLSSINYQLSSVNYYLSTINYLSIFYSLILTPPKPNYMNPDLYNFLLHLHSVIRWVVLLLLPYSYFQQPHCREPSFYPWRCKNGLNAYRFRGPDVPGRSCIVVFRAKRI